MNRAKWFPGAGMFVLAAILLAESSFTGTWVAETTTPSGDKRETTFFLTQKGDQLTGAVLNGIRMQAITEGKAAGTEASWVVVMHFGEQQRRVEYKAKLAGDQLNVTVSGFGPPPAAGRPAAPRELAARKTSSDGTPVHPFSKLPKVQLPALRPLPDNGLARTPPMGWNSWNYFKRNFDDKTVREIADAIASNGMKEAGYIYINIDDTWQGKRDANGVLQPNSKFPNMKALADYVHSKGLKLGIYSSPGPQTCAGYEGSYGHEQIDAKTWAGWGIDYLKYDWCSASEIYKPADMQAAYQLMGEALRATGRPIVYSLCQYGLQHVETWGPAVGGNLWRTTGDISDNWSSMSDIGFNRQIGLERYSGPGHWNDPDMLEIGNGHMTDAEYRTHMSLWAMLAAPLLAGNDVRNMSAETKAILLNREVIAINQDKLGKQAWRVSKDGEKEVWARPLEGGAWAIALFNRGGSTATVSADLSDLKLAGPHKVRDLWKHADLGSRDGSVSSEVPSHSVALLRLN